MEYLKEEFFTESKMRLPARIMVSCGIPSGSKNAIGQCWDPIMTKDRTIHIFICPSQSDTVQVLGILLHELIHAALGLHHKHDRVFQGAIKRVGLKGKPTSTFVGEGTALYTQLQTTLGKLGSYPHSAMIKKTSTKKEQADPLITLISQTDPDYRLKIKESLLEQGLPTDPWDTKMVVETKGTTVNG